MTHHESIPVQSSDSGQALYLPASILISALLLSMAIGISAWEVGGKLDSVSTSIKAVQFNVRAPSAPSGGGTINASPEPQAPPAAKVDMQKLSQGYPTKGDPKAPITIVEFSDFQCPFCGQWFKNAYSQINENYIKKGTVKLVYRHFPLSFHPQANPAANAAECANEQGKFWEMHDRIFTNQEQLSPENYKAWAKEFGLDTTKFNSCYDTKKYDSKVTADFAEGSGVGVSGTPSFFVNGTLIVGAQGYDAFKSAIDAAIKR